MKKNILALFCAAWMPYLCFLSGCAPFSLDNLSSADTAYCFVKASAGVYPIDTDRPDEIAQFADLFDDFDWQLSESSPEDMPYDPWIYHIPEGKIPTEGTVMIFTKGETEIGLFIRHYGDQSYAIVGEEVYVSDAYIDYRPFKTLCLEIEKRQAEETLGPPNSPDS